MNDRLRIPALLLVSLGAVLTASLFAACGDDSGGTGGGDTTSGGDQSVSAITATVATGAGGADPDADRGPTEMPVDGDANGLWWDAPNRRLLLADDNGNRILQWTDAEGFSTLSDLAAGPPDGAGLGQLVLGTDGTIVVTRFGGGSAGDIAYVLPDGTKGIVPNLDPERRRIGLTLAPDGKIFDSFFVRVGENERVGSVGEVGLEGSEPEVITGLGKPVGVLAVGTDLYVSDQDFGQILKFPRADTTQQTVVADVAGCDLLALGPDGDLFSGTTSGEVVRVKPSGDVAVVATGFISVHGVAYDEANRRLFIAEHDEDETDGVDHALHILPIDD